MSEGWAKLVGHAIRGVFPLQALLGRTNHSVVFLTHSEKHGRPELALKLIPSAPGLAQLQLARWRAAAALAHPRLIQIFDTGQYQIGERAFLYVVTDYADQNLGELLERRALTEEETREMLDPVLDALTFLHERKLVQGRLKPSNVLVVGDQLKLASDTIRPFSETGRASRVTSAYSPPEASNGERTAASDVWALGVTLCEALTRQQPSGLHEGDMLLPPEMSPKFRGLIARCLHRRAQNRPHVTELQAWAHGAQLVASVSPSGRHMALAEAAPTGSTSEVIGDSGPSPILAAEGARMASEKLRMGLVVAVILGALAVFVMGWAAVRSASGIP